VIDDQPRSLYFGGHVRKLVLGDLELGELFPKLASLLRVSQSPVKSSFSDPQSLGRDFDPALIEELEDLIKPPALFTYQVGRGDLHIVKREFCCGGHLDPHLFTHVIGREPRSSLLHEDDGLAAVGRFYIGVALTEDENKVADGPVGDEGLHTVDHVFITGPHCGRIHQGDVAPVIRFGEPPAAQELALGDGNQVLQLLLLGSMP